MDEYDRKIVEYLEIMPYDLKLEVEALINYYMEAKNNEEL